MSIKRIGKGFEFQDNLRKFGAFKQSAPKVIANNSLNWFLKGFRTGGGQTDASKSGWVDRNPRKGESGRQPSRLVGKGTGHLRRDFQVIKAVFGQIVLGTKRIPYAIRHNEGLNGMPKREFAGESKELNKQNEGLLTKMLNKVMNI